MLQSCRTVSPPSNLIIDTIDGDFGLGNEPVFLDRFVQEQVLDEVGYVTREDLVEDVVTTLAGGLTDDTRLFEQV